MKKFVIVFNLFTLLILTPFQMQGRTDCPNANSFKEYSSYFQRNLDNLDPVEGIYEITLCARIPDASEGIQRSYKVIIEEDDKLERKDELVVSYLGYRNPHNGYKIPEEDIENNPLISLLHGKILKLNTPYHYGFAFLMPDQDIDADHFFAIGFIHLDPNTYNFEGNIEVNHPKVFKLLNIPESVYNVNKDKIECEITLKGERLSLTPPPAPVCNIGKTVKLLKDEYPNIRYLREDNTGSVYQDGYTEDGISQYFSIINNNVVQESLICESHNDFSKHFFLSMKNSFVEKYPDSIIRNIANEVKFVFPFYSVSISYEEEGKKKITSVIYKRL